MSNKVSVHSADAVTAFPAATGTIINHARIVREPDTKKAWAVHQLLTINWTNIALIITVIAIASNINKQLDEQRVEYTNAQRSLDALRLELLEARTVSVELREAKQRLTEYNATLSLAVSLVASPRWSPMWPASMLPSTFRRVEVPSQLLRCTPTTTPCLWIGPSSRVK